MQAVVGYQQIPVYNHLRAVVGGGTEQVRSRLLDQEGAVQHPGEVGGRRSPYDTLERRHVREVWHVEPILVTDDLHCVDVRDPGNLAVCLERPYRPV